MRRPTRLAANLLASVAVFMGASACSSVSPREAPSETGPSAGASIGSVRSQELVDEALRPMWELVEGDGENSPGYARATVDIDRLTVEIMWKGEPPAKVRALEGINESGVRITIVDVPYSQGDVTAAADKILALGRAGEIPRPTEVSSNDRFDGLRVGLQPTDASKVDQARLAEQLKALTGIPAAIFVGEKRVLLSRQNDNSPWYGGGAMRRGPSGRCSVGFATTASTGADRMISAAHCDVTGNLAWNDGTNVDDFTLGGGDVWVQLADRDSMAIDPVGESAGWVHGGPWNATVSHPRYHVKVGSKYQNAVGDSVCTSGANSGEWCSLRITHVNVRLECLPDEPGSPFCTLHSAVSPCCDRAAAVQGDSGGPVYALRSDGRVSARGTISQGENQVTCPSTASGLDEGCFSTVWFSPINPILDRWEQTIQTTP
jgi:hypothetical protein